MQPARLFVAADRGFLAPRLQGRSCETGAIARRLAAGQPLALIPSSVALTETATLAALEVLLSLRPEVFSQVARVGAPSVAGVTLTLNDGREVIWGTTDRTEEKALKLGALLTQPGHTYDVSSPDLPTVK